MALGGPIGILIGKEKSTALCDSIIPFSRLRKQTAQRVIFDRRILHSACGAILFWMHLPELHSKFDNLFVDVVKLHDD